jgi:CheY-like chemotaxis protein
MKIIWLTDDKRHCKTLSKLWPEDSHVWSSLRSFPDGATTLIVYANTGSGRRSKNEGLRWLQRFRRETRSSASALVYSFETRSSLAQEFSFLNEEMPGVRFIRLPAKVAAFDAELKALIPLTEVQIEESIRWHSGLQSEWKAIIHALTGAVRRFPKDQNPIQKILANLHSTVSRYAPDQINGLERLEEARRKNDDKVLAAIQALEEGLCSRKHAASDSVPEDILPAAPFNCPPAGFSTIAIADDSGYEKSTIRMLKLLGYQIRGPAKSLSAAKRLLERKPNPPQVVLADLNFPTRAEGDELMRTALRTPSIQMVIAISRARSTVGELPEGVEDCCGSLDYQDATRIHRLIWRTAQARGMKDPAGDADRSRIQDCRSSLEMLASLIEDRADHWCELPASIKKATQYAHRILDDHKQEPEVRQEAQNVINVLDRYQHVEEHTHRQIESLAADAGQMIARARNLAGYYQQGSLWLALHSTIEQHLALAAAGLSGLEPTFASTIANLEVMNIESAPLLANEIRHRLTVCKDRELTLKKIEALKETLYSAVRTLPYVERKQLTSWTAVVRTRHFRVIIIEDEGSWQRFARRAVELVKLQLGPEFKLETEYFDNVEDALDALSKRRTGSGDEQAEEAVQIIAIADMGLPRNRHEADLVRAGEMTPDRNNGHEMLRALRAYRINIPVIVLTTPPNLLEDQVRVCEQGIPDYNYILKTPDKLDTLVQAIFGIVERAQIHRVELWEASRHEVRIDDVPVPLGEMAFRTFFALCRLSMSSRDSFTSLRIIDQLDESFGGYKASDEWGNARSVAAQILENSREQIDDIANILRLWQPLRTSNRGNLSRTLKEFTREYPRLWQSGLRLLRERNNDEIVSILSAEAREGGDANLLAEHFERVFGNTDLRSAKDYNPENIEKHMHEIRTGIQEAFKTVHRFIDSKNDVVIQREVDERPGYRVSGEIIFHEYESLEESAVDREDDGEISEVPGPVTPQTAVVTVLVVENEQSYSSRICSLLEGSGYRVRSATNLEDAIAESKVFPRPDILCLDLHIPATREDYEIDPTSGSTSCGLRVLERVRQEYPDIRVAMPTTNFDNDHLRERAAALGVPASNFIPKGQSMDGACWEGHLLLTMSRLRQEIWSRVVLPAISPIKRPLVQILADTNVETGQLRLVVNGRPFSIQKSKQGRLLGLLLQRAGQEVSFDEIDHAVEGKGSIENKRKLWLKNVREKIREEWLGLDDCFPGRPELEILETRQDRVILHVYVEPGL